jgi:hypothetical protein
MFCLSGDVQSISCIFSSDFVFAREKKGLKGEERDGPLDGSGRTDGRRQAPSSCSFSKGARFGCHETRLGKKFNAPSIFVEEERFWWAIDFVPMIPVAGILSLIGFRVDES